MCVSLNQVARVLFCWLALALALDLAGAAGRAAGQSARGPCPSSDRAPVLGAGGRAGCGPAARPRLPAAGTGQGC